MKKITNLPAFFLFLFISNSTHAQLPVSTNPQNKKIMIEEFTGIHCEYCPDGHKTSDMIYNADPTNVIVVNIQTSTSLGTPHPLNDVDLRTPDGAILDNILNYNGWGWQYPSASINRSILSQTSIPNPYRPTWAGDAATISAQPAYCNVALQGTIDVNTRVLNVEAQVYYTSSSPQATNYLTVMLIENNITGRQENALGLYPANINPDSTYNHKHVLRKVLTSIWGDPINNTSAGSTFSTTLNYSIPLKYGAIPYDNNCYLGNLNLIGFVTENTQTLTINAARGPLILTGFTNANDISPINIKTDKQVCEAKLNSQFKFENKGSATATIAVFSYSVNGTAMSNYTWTGIVDPMSVSSTQFIPVISFSAQNNNTLQVGVASINGGSDQNNANDLTSSNSIPLTSFVANNQYIQVTFLQDQYGNECNWRIYDESNNNLIQSDGPWPMLAANGTQAHIKTFTVNTNSCYKMVVYDELGNGINTSYGNGYYAISSGVNVLYTSNGQYGDGETIWFKTAITTDVSNHLLTASEFNVFPNPATDQATISISMFQNQEADVEVINEIGQLMFANHISLLAGENNIKLVTDKWNSGIYTVKINSSNGSLSKKLAVIK